MEIPETTALMLTGFSPCPNDTFMFDGLVHRRVPCPGYFFEPVMEDIEQLNLRAVTGEGALSLTKLSVATLGRVADRYRVLDAGAALGRGVGPLVVCSATRMVDSLDELAGARVAIPGKHTTANLLLRIFGPRDIQPILMRFDEIMDAVAEGRVDAGVVIHESRFTYAARGLARIADLGESWERDTGLPLPLGVICTHRDLEPDESEAITAALAASIDLAWKEPALSWDFIRAHSQELSEEVCRKHIELYVNDYSRSLGDEGRAALETLIARGRAVGFFEGSHSIW